MSLSLQQVEAIASVLVMAAPGTDPLPALRREIREVAFVRCEADDMRGETPFRRMPAFDLFLVDSASHCWRLVPDPALASGVIVAAHAKGPGTA